MDPLIVLFVLLSNFHVMSIAMERVIAVALPTKYSILDSVCYKSATVTTIWTLAVTIVGIVYGSTYHFLNRDDLTTQVFGCLFLAACGVVFLTYTLLFILLMLRERKLRKLLGVELRKHSRSRRNTYIC